MENIHYGRIEAAKRAHAHAHAHAFIMKLPLKYNSMA